MSNIMTTSLNSSRSSAGNGSSSSSNSCCYSCILRHRPQQQQPQRRRRRRCSSSSSVRCCWLLLAVLLPLVAFMSPGTTTTTTTTAAAAAAAATTTAPLALRKKRNIALAKSSSSSSPKSSLRNNNKQKKTNTNTITVHHWLYYHTRVGLAGGIAGAIGTTVLYPMDAAKTLRQANPVRYRSVRAAFWAILTTQTPSVSTSTAYSTSNLLRFQSTLARLFAGLGPAALGAIPSSALYFGAYESMKSVLTGMLFPPISNNTNTNNKQQQQQQQPFSTKTTFWQRFLLTTGAAASGNIVSSAIFVPKEFLKQQLQYHAATTDTATAAIQPNLLMTIVRQHGLRGMYRGYQATLLRNIPTAALRFVIYEELKWMFAKRAAAAAAAASTKQLHASANNPKRQVHQYAAAFWKHFGAGGIAGAVASFVMTPTDVLKTRLSTGQCPLDVPSCFWHILHTTGMGGLYAGAGSRVVFAAAFSSIGFGSLELAKKWLGVPYKNYQEYCEAITSTSTPSTASTVTSKRQHQQRKQRRFFRATNKY